ncbi:MAG: hypothetical protein ACE37K_15825 [Planctomycetota bacterium]
MPQRPTQAPEILVPLGEPLTRIPLTPIGIVDTIRTQLNAVINDNDLRNLLARESWKQSSDAAYKTFLRSSDGMRMTLRENIVMVEVSVPRALRLHNDEQHNVSEEELLRVFQEMTSLLLPCTTVEAEQAGHHWHVTRLDLAINFDGDASSITEVARKLNFRPLIQAAATVFGSDGVAFYGSNHDAIVYRTDKRPQRGKLAKALGQQTFASRSIKNLRFEFRFKRFTAIQRLVQGMRTSDRGLPFMVDTATGREVRTFAIDYQLLHEKLATYALRLGHRDVLDSVLKERGSSRFMVLALARWGNDIPEMWALATECLAERTLRKRRATIGKVQAARRHRRSVVDAAWARPQVSVTLRRRLLDQVAADPGIRTVA